jgi:hypothetical protein
MALAHGDRIRERGARQTLVFTEQWNEPMNGLRLTRDGLEIARQIGSVAYSNAMLGNGVV